MKTWLPALGGLLMLAAPASSQTYEISWWTVDSGGSMGNVGGSYMLDSTSGQHDAGGPFAGSPYVLHSGFWGLAAGGTGDLRDLALGTVIERKSSQGFIGRLVSAMKGGF